VHGPRVLVPGARRQRHLWPARPREGRPAPPTGVYYDWTKTPAAKAGRFSLVRGARELGVDRTMLRRRIDKGDIQADRDANGYFSIEPAEVERVKRDYQCRTPGCGGVALGDSDYCGSRSRTRVSGCPNAGAASLIGKPRPDVAERARRYAKEIADSLRRAGLEPANSAAASACTRATRSAAPHCASATACRPRRAPR
jgi:hypothetical protein